MQSSYSRRIKLHIVILKRSWHIKRCIQDCQLKCIQESFPVYDKCRNNAWLLHALYAQEISLHNLCKRRYDGIAFILIVLHAIETLTLTGLTFNFPIPISAIYWTKRNLTPNELVLITALRLFFLLILMPAKLANLTSMCFCWWAMVFSSH